MLSDPVKIAIAGIGTVGSGVLEILKRIKSSESLKNFNFKISAVASRRKINFSEKFLQETKIFKNAEELINFKDYDVLLETIGGEDGVAKKIIFDALKKKKHVVTANKALVSKYWSTLKEISRKNNCLVKFEAAVAGGIPIIKVLEDFLPSNQINKIYGILNGTCNYILTNMKKKNEDFKQILNKAQKLGYAESNPVFDIDGTDTAQKLSILASLSFNINLEVKKIYTQGIEDIDLIDIKYAESLGYKVKLLGIAEKKNKKILSFVYPCLVNKSEVISEVDDVYNGIVIESNFCKKSFFLGEGAGSTPTATSIVSNLLDIYKYKNNLIFSSESKFKKYALYNINDRVGSYYLRFTALDRPGVISGISNEFKKFSISMKSMLQKDPHINNQKFATIVVTTHNCLERNMIKALKNIDQLKFITRKTIYLRIENLNN